MQDLCDKRLIVLIVLYENVSRKGFFVKGKRNEGRTMRMS